MCVGEHGARTAWKKKALEDARREKETLSAWQQRESKRKRDLGESSTTERREAPPLPEDLWRKILEDIPQIDLFAFASTSKQLRQAQVESGRKLRTVLRDPTFYLDEDIIAPTPACLTWCRDYVLGRKLAEEGDLEEDEWAALAWLNDCLALVQGKFFSHASLAVLTLSSTLSSFLSFAAAGGGG